MVELDLTAAIDKLCRGEASEKEQKVCGIVLKNMITKNGHEDKMKNTIDKETVDKIYALLHEKGVSTSEICKRLNVNYMCFKAMLDGKQPCYKGWRKEIADILKVDQKELFK